MECECGLKGYRVVLRVLFGVAAAVLFVLGSAACSSDGDEGTVVVASDGTEDTSPETVATTTASPSEKPEDAKAPTTTAGLVDEKAGLEAIVDEFLAGKWARNGLREAYPYAHTSMLQSDDPAIKLRGEFELNIVLELDKNSYTNDPYFTQLYGLAGESYAKCFLDELDYKPVEETVAFSPERQQELFDELGWGEQQVAAVVDRCWTEALEFRSLGEGEGERLLDLQRKYYIDIAREWAAANPDLVVPLPG